MRSAPWSYSTGLGRYSQLAEACQSYANGMGILSHQHVAAPPVCKPVSVHHSDQPVTFVPRAETNLVPLSGRRSVMQIATQRNV